jgi:hypothetical protein
MKCFRLRCCLVALLITVIYSCSKPVDDTGFDWPQWRGPDGNGQSRETEWDPASIATPRILWTADVDVGYSNVVIQDGRLYTLGMEDKAYKDEVIVTCLDAATGKQIWRRPFAAKGVPPQTTPAVDGDSLFVLTTNGILYHIDPRSGKQRWRKDIVADYGAVKPLQGFAGSPVVDGDLVLLTSNTAGMAIRHDTGDLAWTSEKPPKYFKCNATDPGVSYSTPVLYDEGGRRMGLFVSWRGITSVDIGTGTPVWQYDHAVHLTYATPDPLIVGDKVCVPLAEDALFNHEGYLLRVQGAVPRLLWKTADLFSVGSSPVAVGGYLYSVYYGLWGPWQRPPTSLRCFNLESGRVLWEELFGKDYEDKSFALAGANGILLMLTDRGILYTAEASPEGFKEIAHCDVLQEASRPRKFWTPPVLCNAKIYCRNFAGDLVCIDVSN